MPQSTAGAAEDGFTLIELIIYSMLLVVILGLVGTLLINSLNTEKDVRSITVATNQGQVVADSIQTGVRNSSDLIVSTPAGTDQLLRARTAGGADAISWQCAAWYYSAALGEIRYRASAVAILAPTATELKTWTLLAPGVTKSGADPVFNESEPGTLTLSFSSTATGNAPVAIKSTAISRVDAFVSLPCF